MKKFLITFLLFVFVYSSNAFGNQPKSIGKYKSWEAFIYSGNKGKLSVTARTSTGTETKDMYSMMGFTKAYNTARKSCA